MGKYSLILLLLFILSNAMAAEVEDRSISVVEDPLPPNNVNGAPSFALPAPPVDNDCGFYNASWHAFLHVTQADKTGTHAFLHFPSISDLFPSAFQKVTNGSSRFGSLDLQVRDPEPILDSEKREAKKKHNIDDGFTQAQKVGIGSVLVDVNRTFFKDNRLDDTPCLFLPSNDPNAVPTDLEFRAGSLELKASWMIVEDNSVDYSTYVVIDGQVPFLQKLKDASGKDTLVIDSSRTPRDVKLALLGIHVVEVLDGHPVCGRRSNTPIRPGHQADSSSICDGCWRA
ncbi:hypothetical protein [Rhizobium ruizarguesonis]|uniref:hypothetical protein n=1 Tax=Rhizobium ruizarguesonis TaxID=2081791 RepID=UPI001CF3EDAB|nr:hypothetical protein [Rhizobium ruizarguesonis]MCB2399354.1 hypothetical protein [Rhizobium ruizarguesonis]